MLGKTICQRTFLNYRGQEVKVTSAHTEIDNLYVLKAQITQGSFHKSVVTSLGAVMQTLDDLPGRGGTPIYN